MSDAFWQASCRPTGVEEHEQMNIGVPQELGKPCRFHGNHPGGRYRVNNSRLVASQTVATRDTKATACTVVSLSNGNGVKRNE